MKLTNEITGLFEADHLNVVATKPMPKGGIKKGDKCKMIMNKDGTVTIKCPERDSKVDFKDKKAAMSSVSTSSY